MSPLLDLPIALAVWLFGFAWLSRFGSWLPLAFAALLAAARLLAGDPETRRLLQPRGSALAIGAACGVAMAGATYPLYALAVRLYPALAGPTRQLYGILNAGGYSKPVLLALVTMIAASEEILWRGRLLSRFFGSAAAPARPRLGQWFRVLGHAVVYAAAHLMSGSALLIALAFACGLAWGVQRVVTRSLWTTVVTHVLWDAAVMVLWPLE